MVHRVRAATATGGPESLAFPASPELKPCGADQGVWPAPVGTWPGQNACNRIKGFMWEKPEKPE